MDNQEIGIATLHYDKKGHYNGGGFEPTMQIEISQGLMSELTGVCIDGEDKIAEHVNQKIRDQADMVFATWFQKMNEIELADRSQYEIGTEVTHCSKYPNGKIRSVKLRFVFRHL